MNKLLRLLLSKNAERPKTQGNYMELVGPAGVGKSTILAKLNGRTSGEWHYKKNLPGLRPKYRDDAVDGQLHWQLLHAKAGNLEKRDLNGFRKTKLMSYFTGVALSDIIMLNSETEKGIWLDEGLCHNFSEELNGLSDEDFRAIMLGRALIFVMPRHNMTVVERIRKREKDTGHMVTYHIGLNNDELKALVETHTADLDKLMQRAEAVGVPTCRVFAEDGLTVVSDVILRFELQLLSRLEENTEVVVTE